MVGSLSFTKPLTLPRRGRPIPRTQVVDSATIREFDGGLNVIDNDLNLDVRFAKKLDNMSRLADGSIGLRYGTRWFQSIPELERIIEVAYYELYAIAFGVNGKIAAVDARGSYAIIWDDTIAALLPGTPAGWNSGLTLVSFAHVNGYLLAFNGINKPLQIDKSLRCQYIFDPVSGGNANTPITKYGVSAGRYAALFGSYDPALESIVNISNVDTFNTYVGDAAPNDAVTLDIAPFVKTGRPRIRGGTWFRNRLLIACDECILVIELGNYAGTPEVHLPSVEDTIDQYGSMSHRAIQSLGDDVLLCDTVGVPSVKRATFTDSLSPNRESQLIDPAIQERLAVLGDDSLEERVFSVYNRHEGQYMLFVPDADQVQDTHETIAFVYTKIPALKVNAWSVYRDWNWSAACRTSLGRILFAKDDALFLYGATGRDENFLDYVGYEEPFDDDTEFDDGHGFAVDDPTDGDQIALSGSALCFDWIWPWADLDKRMNKKQSKYINIEAKGAGKFTIEMFVDNLMIDPSDFGEAFSDDLLFDDGWGFDAEDRTLNPELTMEFVGSDSPGFGVQPFGQAHFGGGRVSSHEGGYHWPAEFKIMKFRAHGCTRARVQFVSFSMAYTKASIRR